MSEEAVFDIDELDDEPEGIEIPSTLPVLPLKETVVFPGSLTPLAIGQDRSVRLVDDVVSDEPRILALVTSRNDEVEEPGWDDLYEVGTAAIVDKMVKVPDGTLRVLVRGLERIRLERRAQDEPYLVGEFTTVPDVVVESDEVEALMRNVQTLFQRIIGLVPYLPEELQIALANVDEPSALVNFVASLLRIKTDEKQRLLESANIEERLRELLRVLNRELELLELGSRIQSQMQSEMEKGQREFFLRQQLKAIQEELGEGDEQQAEVAELRARIDEANLPEEAHKAATRELSRLEKLPPAAAEYGVIRSYLDWILTLPWNETTEDNLDLQHAREILDEDHYDLEKVKERIIEYLAVSKLKDDVSGPILCFVGPPGVGKTSLGQSIARTLGRKFIRISVGGVRDEAEIRGHRRTYVGALPGTIIRALRDAESKNPVFLIDEIDKMGADFRGDPASAMLEVLDPAQHDKFRDHYLDLPFDLSRVLFICTANQLETIPPPAARPGGRDPPLRLHGRREADDRAQVPRSTPARGARARRRTRRVRRRRAHPRHPRVHARGRPPQPRAADRCALPQGGAADRRGKRGADPCRPRACPRVARPASLPGRGAQAHRRARRRDRTCRHRRRRRRALHRGDRVSRRRTPQGHGTARRGHAGVGPGGVLVGSLPRT